MNKNDFLREIDGQLSEIRGSFLNLLASNSDFSLADFEQLAKICRQRRQELKLSQARLAELTGLAIRTINKFEQGDEGISLKNVKLICQAIGVRPCIKN